jgi:competence protein ComEC
VVAAVLAILLGTIDRTPPPRIDAVKHVAAGWIASRRNAAERAGVRCSNRTTLPAAGVWCVPPRRLMGRVRVHGAVRAPHSARHFHARRSPRRRRVARRDRRRAALRDRGGSRSATARRAVLEPLRSSIQRAYATHLAAREAALLAALVVGIRDDVDATTQDSWRELGLAHILSISGMHVALVAGALLAWLGAPRTLSRVSVLLAGIWLYAGLGGLGPTVLRAACMATWAAVAVWSVAPRGVVGLGVAALALTLQTPERRYDLGFQLSCPRPSA